MSKTNNDLKTLNYTDYQTFARIFFFYFFFPSFALTRMFIRQTSSATVTPATALAPLACSLAERIFPYFSLFICPLGTLQPVVLLRFFHALPRSRLYFVLRILVLVLARSLILFDLASCSISCFSNVLVLCFDFIRTPFMYFRLTCCLTLKNYSERVYRQVVKTYWRNKKIVLWKYNVKTICILLYFKYFFYNYDMTEHGLGLAIIHSNHSTWAMYLSLLFFGLLSIATLVKR